ncbi:MAG: CDP-alcohol phosphatidyltransferase family protein [Paracoccus sp. (in: a-proteobacteria)]|nr:CDP-alcohol phosphatidyltransferase family protein [Paracoccus sp. (in: a-proteobacteria)]
MNRRPLDSRNTRWAAYLSARLASRDVTPNAISQAGMGAAAVSGAAFWATAFSMGATTTILLVLAALACQVRLLCNLLDGMVAIEGGKSTPDGPLWNEFPDRMSDILILMGVGLGTGAPALGLAASLMAVLTAYTRELGTGIGLAPDFSGPMAKPHRMALITGAALLAIFAPVWGVLQLALWIVVLGGFGTAIRRAVRIRNRLLSGDDLRPATRTENPTP